MENTKHLEKFFDKLSEEDVKKLKKVDADILMSLDEKTIDGFDSIDDYLKFKKNLKNETKPDKEKLEDAFQVKESSDEFISLVESMRIDEKKKMIDKRIERQERKSKESREREKAHREAAKMHADSAKSHEANIHAKSGKNVGRNGFMTFLKQAGKVLTDESDYKIVKDPNTGESKMVPDYEAMKRHKFERGMCGMAATIEQEKDPKKKELAQKKFDLLMRSIEYDSEGRPCGCKIDKKVAEKMGVSPYDVAGEVNDSDMQAKGGRFQAAYGGDFRKDFTSIAKAYDRERESNKAADDEKTFADWHKQRGETLKDRKEKGTNLGARFDKFFKGKGESNASSENDESNASSEKDKSKAPERKEKVVKDKDGSEIHARAKKTGEGTTYVRIKNGHEIGYANKEEFIKAKQRKAKKANEGFLSLVDYMMIN